MLRNCFSLFVVALLWMNASGATEPSFFANEKGIKYCAGTNLSANLGVINPPQNVLNTFNVISSAWLLNAPLRASMHSLDDVSNNIDNLNVRQITKTEADNFIQAVDNSQLNLNVDNEITRTYRLLKKVNGAGNLPSLIRQLVSKPSYKPLRTIWSKENKTTTFIGKWDELVSGQQNGLQKIYGELTQSDLNIYMQTGQFDHPGGFNMLSIDNFPVKQAEYAQKISSGQINSSLTFDDYIWDAYNKPWLESALQRGDDIVIWSDPINSSTGLYKRELEFIQNKASQYGYDYIGGITSGTFSK